MAVSGDLDIELPGQLEEGLLGDADGFVSTVTQRCSEAFPHRHSAAARRRVFPRRAAQANLFDFYLFMPYSGHQKEVIYMPRTKRRVPKVKLTITIEPAVVKALGPLQTRLEELAHGGNADLQVLYGPQRYSRSTAVQLAILTLCKKHGVEIPWENP